MQEPPFTPGSCVRVKEGADFAKFRGGERGTVESYNEDCRNYSVMLGDPPRRVRIGRRHLEPITAAIENTAAQSGVVASAPAASRWAEPREAPRRESGAGAGTSGPGPEDVCRFCLEVGEEPLVSPCGCRGSARWVHAGCLRRWQRSVVLSAGNSRPEDLAAEWRHRRCAACCCDFAAGLEPAPRGQVLERLAGIAAEDIRPGALLRYAAEYPRPQFEPGYECLIHIFEAQKEHFRNSVYLLTQPLPPGAGAARAAEDGGPPVIGVNLTRPLQSRWSAPAPLEELTRGALTDADLRAWRRAGVAVSVGLGGPVQPRALGPTILIADCEDGGFATGECGALRDRALRLARDGGAGRVELRLFLGHARWSQEQLLGEVTRQSWALVPDGASAADLGSEVRHLWRQLEDDGRLRWAPENPLAEEHRHRMGAS